LSGWRVLAQKTGALAEFGNFLGNSVDFWSVWSGLGPLCNSFSEAKGTARIFTNIQGPQRNTQQVQGAWCKIHMFFLNFLNFLPTEKSMYRVHGAVDRQCGRVHGGPTGGMDIGHCGASPAHGARALEVADNG
jgi:hypothetical protein